MPLVPERYLVGMWLALSAACAHGPPPAGTGVPVPVTRPDSADPSASPAPFPSPASSSVDTPTPSWPERLGRGRIHALGASGDLQAPAGLWSAGDALWTADIGGHAVWSFDGVAWQRRIGWGARGWSGDGGPGPEGQLWAPYGGVVRHGEQWVADFGNGRLRVLDAAGYLRSVPWPQSLPMLQGPAGLAVASSGQVLVADYLGHRLFRLDPDVGTGEVLAGTGRTGKAEAGDDALQAPLERPLAVALDPDGTVWIGEAAHGRLLHLQPDGRWQVAAGDVPEPAGLLWDESGGWLVASGSGHQVLWLSTDGERRVIAGTGAEGDDGDGGPSREAALGRPVGLAAWQGGLAISDMATGRLRWVEPAP
ncbi:MAG: NHL repeat-containing protein [Candidatus Sericytochromatia bacterium]|nr:NHL repeat-containing protein [Candidatus Sericytochromatia bacterium]